MKINSISVNNYNNNRNMNGIRKKENNIAFGSLDISRDRLEELYEDAAETNDLGLLKKALNGMKKAPFHFSADNFGDIDIKFPYGKYKVLEAFFNRNAGLAEKTFGSAVDDFVVMKDDYVLKLYKDCESVRELNGYYDSYEKFKLDPATDDWSILDILPVLEKIDVYEKKFIDMKQGKKKFINRYM